MENGYTATDKLSVEKELGISTGNLNFFILKSHISADCGIVNEKTLS